MRPGREGRCEMVWALKDPSASGAPCWASGQPGSVDLEQVEGCAGQPSFAFRGCEAVPAEPVHDLLEVPDRRFNGGSPTLVEAAAFLSIQPPLHGRCSASDRDSAGRRGVCQ